MYKQMHMHLLSQVCKEVNAQDIVDLQVTAPDGAGNAAAGAPAITGPG